MKSGWLRGVQGYAVVVADPPWQFGDDLPGDGRGASKHYKTMTTDAICAFRAPGALDDAILFLWRVSSMVEDAYRVVRAWGYEPKSEIVWRKTSPIASCAICLAPRVRLGMGHYVRAAHETCIIAGRGRSAGMRLDFSIPSVFDAPAREHSAKPEEFYQLVERLYPGPYADVFSRRTRKGWDAFGDETGKLDAGAGAAAE
jgi:N6-adenosine-specific RNA methylase IME4